MAQVAHVVAEPDAQVVQCVAVQAVWCECVSVCVRVCVCVCKLLKVHAPEARVCKY